MNDLQGHSRALRLLPFDRPYYDFLLVFHCKCIYVLHRFRDVNTYFAKKLRRHDVDHAHLGAICNHKTNTSRANPCTQFDDSIFSHSSKKIRGVKF